jgi:hypothetical protein
MKIRIFSVWGDLVDEFTHRFGNHDFVNDDSYTYAIILNNYIPKEPLLTDSKHTIGIAMEPVEFLGLHESFIAFVRKHIGKYFVGEYASRLGLPFVNKRFFLTYMDYPNVISIKDRVMSIAFSKKQTAPGHKYRHILIKTILNTNLPIDIYGHGCDLEPYSHSKDPRLKGAFDSDLVVHERYKYHIAIENYRREWYYTEKIINPLQCGTIPLYWGCPNINDIFPEVPIIPLTGNINMDMITITEICRGQPDILFDRSKIREYISFTKVIDELITL